MNKSDFLMRTVTYEDTIEDYGNKGESTYLKISAVRMRTTEGNGSIQLRIGEDLTFSLSSETHGGSYELIARTICEVLEKAADDTCLLPKDLK